MLIHFFFNYPPTPEIYTYGQTLSLHDALPSSSPALSPMKRPWIVIACAAFIVTLAMGVRQSFGLFLPQMSVDIGISRSDFGLAMALQNLLFGLVQPFVGAIAEKHGAGRVVLAGALLYALGLIGAALAIDAIGLHIQIGRANV